MRKYIVIGIVAVLLVGIGFAGAQLSFKDKIAQVAGEVLGQDLSKEFNLDEKEFGALPGPQIMSKYLDVGGVTTYYKAMEPRSGTTTPCSIQAPVGTSTLVYFAFDNETATTSAAIVEIGKADTAYATTTLLGPSRSITANDADIYYASTTQTTTDENNLTTIGSEDYVNVKMWSTATATGKIWRSSDDQNGKCVAIFRSTE